MATGARGVEGNAGRAWRAQVEAADRPQCGIAMQPAGQVLQGTAAQHDLLGAEIDLGGDRQTRQCRERGTECGQDARRRRRILVVARHEFIGIELACRQRRMQQRCVAETCIAGADEFQRAILRAVAEFDLVELGGQVIGLDLGRDLPGGRRGLVALLRRRRRQRRHALEPRHARLEREHAFEIGCWR